MEYVRMVYSSLIEMRRGCCYGVRSVLMFSVVERKETDIRCRYVGRVIGYSIVCNLLGHVCFAVDDYGEGGCLDCLENV